MFRDTDGQEGSLPLSAEALAALQKGSKIAAIKVVRTEECLGLKEAKERVERYIETHPEVAARLRLQTIQVRLPQLLRFLVFVAVGALLVLWWRGA
jgi:hypothetical protein